MLKYLSFSVRRLVAQLDRINEHVSSYRLVLYALLSFLAAGIIGALFGELPYSAGAIALSATWLLAVCWGSNRLIAKFMDIPANKESDLITALILALILAPPVSASGYAITGAAALAAITSKYVITISKSHIFNPAAVGALTAGLIFNKYPAWWVGNRFITPLVIIFGLLILRKMNRFAMAAAFLATFLLLLIYSTGSGGSPHFLWQELISTQVLFFTVIMLTEPMTSPSRLSASLIYAVAVGVLYTLTKLKFSPEEALLAGNLLSFLLTRNRRYSLRFIRSIKEAKDVYSYSFAKPKDFKFEAGQYMEWTIAHNRTDRRGNRRYLTIASSPTEPDLMFTVKQVDKASAFKHRLQELKPGENILAARLAGSFTLPKDTTKKIVLMAGGVGITPFRSMIKYLLDSSQRRDVLLIYSAGGPEEFAYGQLFKQAAAAGIKLSYHTGRLEVSDIKELLPDLSQRQVYISGPYQYVNYTQELLILNGAAPSLVITDYFPGYGS